jgi:hypothetical protein
LLRVRALSLVVSAPEELRDLTCHPFHYLREIGQLASDGRDVLLRRQGAPILRLSSALIKRAASSSSSASLFAWTGLGKKESPLDGKNPRLRRPGVFPLLATYAATSSGTTLRLGRPFGLRAILVTRASWLCGALRLKRP